MATKKPKPLKLDPDLVFILNDGSKCTGAHLRSAMTACRILAMAYALASEDNGGGSRSISWESLDSAAKAAEKAMEPEMDFINVTARYDNGMVKS